MKRFDITTEYKGCGPKARISLNGTIRATDIVAILNAFDSTETFEDDIFTPEWGIGFAAQVYKVTVNTDDDKDSESETPESDSDEACDGPYTTDILVTVRLTPDTSEVESLLEDLLTTIRNHKKEAD